MSPAFRPLLALLGLLAGCGASPPAATLAPVSPPQPPAPVETHAATAGCPAASGAMVIEGAHGTLPQAVVERVMREATRSLSECYTRRLAALPFLEGHVELKIHVAADGAVRWAVPSASTLGDRETERCMTDRARALRFTATCGGEAEVLFPLDMDGGGETRPATPWEPSRLAAVVRQHHAALARCAQGAAGSVAVTVYAAPDGTVAAAGASVASDEALGAADCLVHEVTTWRVPSPGSWYARTTLQLP